MTARKKQINGPLCEYHQESRRKQFLIPFNGRYMHHPSINLECPCEKCSQHQRPVMSQFVSDLVPEGDSSDDGSSVGSMVRNNS